MKGNTMKTLTVITILALGLSAVQAQTKEQMQAEIVRLRADLTAARVEIARFKQMPIEVEQRKALTGAGQVLHLQNLSTKTLPVKVTLISPTFGKTNTFDIVLNPARVTPTSKEIGHAEGWAAAPGDLVQIESAGYIPIRKHF